MPELNLNVKFVCGNFCCIFHQYDCRLLWCQCISSSRLLQSNSMVSNWSSREEVSPQEKVSKDLCELRTIFLMLPYFSSVYLCYCDTKTKGCIVRSCRSLLGMCGIDYFGLVSVRFLKKLGFGSESVWFGSVQKNAVRFGYFSYLLLA